MGQVDSYIGEVVAAARVAKAHVRALQRQQDRERGRRVLRPDFPVDGVPGDSDADSSDGNGGRRGPQRKRRRTKQDSEVCHMPLHCELVYCPVSG